MHLKFSTEKRKGREVEISARPEAKKEGEKEDRKGEVLFSGLLPQLLYVRERWQNSWNGEREIRSCEVSPYNRLASLTYESLFCMPSLPPSTSSLQLLLLHSVLSRPPSSFLSLRSRCTVAFGLCIIITVTATSSSWRLPSRSTIFSCCSTWLKKVQDIVPR